MGIHYRNVSCASLTADEIVACARLFSMNYGVWAKSAGDSYCGKRISLSPQRFKTMFVDKPDRYVVLMYDGDTLMGQVFYLRRQSPWHKDRFVTFVLQLVVDQNYRGKRYGLKMLQAVFGLSNDDAWGLFTSNPLTIRALEDATFRRIDVATVRRAVDSGLRNVLFDVFDDCAWLDSFRNGCVNTHFHVGHDENERKLKKAYPDRPFPFSESLRDGEEWLAVIRWNQDVHVTDDIITSLTATSWTILSDAYARMDIASQSWASHADREVEFLFSNGYVKPGDRVLDLGCGTGRHCVELAKRGAIVHGVDFSDELLRKASSRLLASGVSTVTLEQGDARYYKAKDSYDVVLCLYDVIGSSIRSIDGEKVVKTITGCLKSGGVAVASVMNLELTRARVGNRRANIFSDITSDDDFTKLLQLPASRTMQQSGDVFKGQLILLNPETGVTYRREQFVEENALPTEYVIPDRRYTLDQLRQMFSGYEELYSAYVSAGRWHVSLRPDEIHAKEALGVFRKQSVMSRVFGRASGEPLR